MTEAQRRRGRPALAPENQRVKRGVSLPQHTWAQLAELKAWWGASADKIIERMIADAHLDESAIKRAPEATR